MTPPSEPGAHSSVGRKDPPKPLQAPNSWHSKSSIPCTQAQPTQVALVPHLRGLKGFRELVPGTGSGLISDLLSHKGAILEAAETHTG